MKDWLKKRLEEPSSYAGLALMTMGIGDILKVKEAPAIADAVQSAGQAVTGGDWQQGAMIFAFGLFSAFMGEKKR